MLYLHMLVLLWACPTSTATGRLREFYLEHSNTAMRITEARKKCLRYTDLVTVYDQLDNDKLAKMLLKQSATCAWIGAYNGTQWSDGAVATFRNFTFEESGCATMRFNEDWECIQCLHGKNFICYDKDKETKTDKSILQNKNWLDAQKYCSENHSVLVSITNEEENNQVYIKGQYSTPFWIGFEWKSSRRSWSYYSNCFLYQSENWFTQMYLNGSWKKSDINDSTSALCYKSFIHVSKTKMSWEDALDYCNASGLLRIESKDDQIETERELRRKKISEPVWIGLRQSRLFGFWIWMNGLHVGNWTNWKGGRQPEHQISHHCGVMEEVDGTFKWTDKDCRSKFRVLCEIR